MSEELSKFIHEDIPAAIGNCLINFFCNPAVTSLCVIDELLKEPEECIKRKMRELKSEFALLGMKFAIKTRDNYFNVKDELFKHVSILLKNKISMSEFEAMNKLKLFGPSCLIGGAVKWYQPFALKDIAETLGCTDEYQHYIELFLENSYSSERSIRDESTIKPLLVEKGAYKIQIPAHEEKPLLAGKSVHVHAHEERPLLVEKGARKSGKKEIPAHEERSLLAEKGAHKIGKKEIPAHEEKPLLVEKGVHKEKALLEGYVKIEVKEIPANEERPSLEKNLLLEENILVLLEILLRRGRNQNDGGNNNKAEKYHETSENCKAGADRKTDQNHTTGISPGREKCKSR